jgi:hypothetical protein
MKPAFFPKTPYEGPLLQSLGNFGGFIRFISSTCARVGFFGSSGRMTLPLPISRPAVYQISALRSVKSDSLSAGLCPLNRLISQPNSPGEQSSVCRPPRYRRRSDGA